MPSRIEILEQAVRQHPEGPALQLVSRDELDAAIALSPDSEEELGADLTIAQFVLLVSGIGRAVAPSEGAAPAALVLARGLTRVLPAAADLAAARRLRKF